MEKLVAKEARGRIALRGGVYQGRRDRRLRASLRSGASPVSLRRVGAVTVSACRACAREADQTLWSDGKNKPGKLTAEQGLEDDWGLEQAAQVVDVGRIDLYVQLLDDRWQVSSRLQLGAIPIRDLETLHPQVLRSADTMLVYKLDQLSESAGVEEQLLQRVGPGFSEEEVSQK